MPGQGWAGSKATPEGLSCAVCLKLESPRNRPPVTQIAGTLVCEEHVAFVALPLHPTAGSEYV